MKLAHENHAKVLLDGQGGDEVFGGYLYYFGYYFYELLKKRKLQQLARESVNYYRVQKNLYPYLFMSFLLLPGIY